MRLIDADELMTHSCHYNFEEQGYFEFDAVDVDDIRNAPTITVEPTWIKLTDRPPKKQGKYMCAYRDCFGELTYGPFMFFKDDPFFKDGFHLYLADDHSFIGVEKLLYWLEMPEIPEV